MVHLSTSHKNKLVRSKHCFCGVGTFWPILVSPLLFSTW